MSGTKDEDASRAASDSSKEEIDEYLRRAKIDEELELLRHKLGREPDCGTKYDVGLNFEPEMEEFRKLERMRQSNNNGHPAQEKVGNKPENQNNIAINPDDEKSA